MIGRQTSTLSHHFVAAACSVASGNLSNLLCFMHVAFESFVIPPHTEQASLHVQG